MRAIIDTNVFVSGVFFSGPPYRILEAWRDQKLRLILSQEILDEYLRVGKILSGRFPAVDLSPIIELVTIEAEIYTSLRLPRPICEDPDDDKFLACAVASRCRLIISGDKHLLRVSGYRGITVIKPRDFVERYLQ